MRFFNLETLMMLFTGIIAVMSIYFIGLNIARDIRINKQKEISYKECIIHKPTYECISIFNNRQL